jgi:hypothetical protein
MSPFYLARGASKVRSFRPIRLIFPPDLSFSSLRRRRCDFGSAVRGFDLQVLRRITAETSVELKILSEKWQLLLAGIVFQVPIHLCCLWLLGKEKLARCAFFPSGQRPHDKIDKFSRQGILNSSITVEFDLR